MGFAVKTSLRRRFWLETTLAGSSSGLLVLTIVRPQWIEALLGVEPDAGDGSLEWAIVGVLALVTALLFASALREWRRRVRPPSPYGSTS